MKRFLSLLLSIITMLSVTCGMDFSAYAEDVAVSGSCGNDATWSFDIKTGVLMILGSGAMTDYTYWENAPWYKEKNRINTILINKGITHIGNYSFYDCKELENILIPSTIISIGDDAFNFCENLSNVYIEDLTNWMNISFYNRSSSPLYYAENLFENNKLVTDVFILDGIKSINSYVFYSYNKLKKVTIPDSVINIGDYAFYGCSSLTNIVIPDSVVSIGNSAFSKCNNLVSANIPNRITSIENDMFSECNSLTSITIPDSVINIGDYAFYGCSSLTNIVIPDSVASIGNSAFNKCNNLASANIPNGITSIEKDMFRECNSLTSITIPDSVTNIGDYAFYGCSSLTNIVIPDSVTTIGNSAFRDCSSLENLSIGKNVYSINSYAFLECKNLTSVTIPNNTEEIGMKVFSECPNLKSINVGANNIYYSSQDGVLFDKDKTELIQYPANNSRSSYVVPSGIKYISKEAFYGCENLTSISLPESLHSVGDSALSCCNNLKSISVDANNEYLLVQDGVLFDKSKTRLIQYPIGDERETYIVPDGVEIIEYEAFSNCSGIKNITLPKSLYNLYSNVFYNCINLANVIIPYNSELRNIPNLAFYGCKNITNISLSKNIKSIGLSAFNGCSSLKEIILPDTLTSIDRFAFANCSSLTNITIPPNVTNINNYGTIFKNCNSLTSIDVADNNSKYSSQDGVLFNKNKTTLIKYPNANMGNTYIIPDSVEYIDTGAFDNCCYLTDIYYSKSEENWHSAIGDISNNDFNNINIHFITHNHKYSNVSIVKPNCLNYGVDQLICDECDITKLKIIPISGHEVVIDVKTSATCIESGLTEGSHCSICEEVLLAQQEIPAIGHSYDNGVIAKESTCISKGLKKFTCEVCGDSYTEEVSATGHTQVIDESVEPTCNAIGLTQGSRCSVCNEIFKAQETIPMIPHKYASSVVQATADSQGYIKYTCSVCGDTYNTDYFNAATIFSENITAKADEIVKIPIYIKDNNGLMGWKLTFNYDADVLTPISVENGNIIDNGYLDNNIDGNMKPGSINVYWSGDDNKTYNGIMFYINFSVNDNAVGNTNVDVSFSQGDTFDLEYNDVYLNCEKITLNIENDNYTQSAKINVSSQNITAGDDLELKLNISEIKNVSKISISIDYDSNVFDFISINSISGITIKNINSNGKLMLDISGITGNTNNKDFVTVVFKCKDNATSGDYNFNVCANESGIICKGCTVNVSPSATSELARVYADDINANKGDIITVPIMIDNNHGVMGYGLNFTYDTSLLEVISATRGSSFSGNFNDSIGLDDGEFIVLWNGAEDNHTNGNLLNLKFKVLSDEITDTVISMTYSQDDTFNESWEDVVFDCKDINVSLNQIHYHSFEISERVEPTCEAQGYIVYSCKCGETYTEYLVNLQHNYNVNEIVEPTCTGNGYTSYMCSRCGNTYTDNETTALGHNYGEYVSNNDATYEADGTKTAVCSRCGEKDTIIDEGSKLVKEPDLNSFVIKTVSLSLESSITMNFKVLKSVVADFENPYMVFKCEGLDDMTVTEYIEQGDYYVFSFPGISPQMMGNDVTAKLYATYKENGQEYSSQSKSMSVKEYSYKMLATYGSINNVTYNKLKTLLVDLLNYGAQAQLYTKYKTNSLVNADLTETQKSWGTSNTPTLTNITDKEYKTISNPTAVWNTAGLVLNNSVMVRGKFTVASVENVTVKISCNGRTFTYDKNDFTKNSDGSYYVYCNEIYANEMSKEILMTVYDNGVQCSNTMKFSIESYAKAIQDSAYAGTALDNLTQAMMRYGKSAEAYGI